MNALRQAALGLTLVLFCNIVHAEEPTRAMPASAVDIRSPTLLGALIALQQQTGLQFICPTDGTGETPVPSFAGVYTPRAAIEKLLKDSGLKYEFINERTVAISSKAGTSGAARAPAADVTKESASAAEHLEEMRSSMPEILVEGSRLLNMDIKRSRDDVQPYVVFDRQAIERSGAEDIEDFLRNQLTMATPGLRTGLINAQPATLGNVSSISLRGLSEDETLILIDGHRAASYADTGTAGQPDLNAIPLSAVERIDVLPTTASGIYGGSATGGAINVILRRDYDGIETKLTYHNTFGGGGATRRVNLGGGFDLEGGRTSVIVVGSYSDASDLLARDRDFVQRGHAHILANNPSSLLGAFFPPLGATTNIQGVDLNTFGPVELTLKDGTPLGSSITSIPQGYAGVTSDSGAGLINNAGRYDLDLANTAQHTGGRQGLLNAPTVKSLMTTVRREFLPGLQGFLELAGSDNVGSFAHSGASSTFLIPESAASNPFGQTVVVNTPALGADGRIDSTLQNRRVVAGAIVKLPKAWQAAADYTWNRTRLFRSAPGALDLTTSQAAVESGVVDLFRDTNAFATDFSHYLLGRRVFHPVDTSLKDFAVRFSGPLPWLLPGGMPTLSILVEHRKELLDDSSQTVPITSAIVREGTFYGRSQTVDSVYVESRVPVVSGRNAVPGVYSFELQVAGRRDHYDVVGANSTASFDPQPLIRMANKFASTDPTVGLRYQPLSDLMLRASFGTGFLPPGMNQLVPDSEQTIPAEVAELIGLTDPLRGNERLPAFRHVAGGNPGLQPERSASWSAGMILTPRFAPRLRVSLDWTRIDKRDNIATILGLTPNGLSDLINFAPGRITRGPPSDGFPVGPIEAIDSTYINIARAKVEACDVTLGYSVPTATAGTFGLAASGTRQIHNLTQATPSAPLAETAGVRSDRLKWKANAALTWDWRRWNFTWNTRFFDAYWLDMSRAIVADQGAATVPSQIYHDFYAGYDFAEQGPAALFSNVRIRLGIRNVFNKLPPVDTGSGLLFYSAWGDPRLASYNLSLTKRF